MLPFAPFCVGKLITFHDSPRSELTNALFWEVLLSGSSVMYIVFVGLLSVQNEEDLLFILNHLPSGILIFDQEILSILIIGLLLGIKLEI